MEIIFAENLDINLMEKYLAAVGHIGPPFKSRMVVVIWETDGNG